MAYCLAANTPYSFVDPTGQFLVLPWVIGAGIDIVADVVSIGVGAIIGKTAADYIYNAKPPENAYDPNGPKAPGKPGEAEGFRDPKGGENWVPNPNPRSGGSSHGWEDDKGRVWCPTGQGGRAHGGPHWDVQKPGGGYDNVFPVNP